MGRGRESRNCGTTIGTAMCSTFYTTSWRLPTESANICLAAPVDDEPHRCPADPAA